MRSATTLRKLHAVSLTTSIMGPLVASSSYLIVILAQIVMYFVASDL